jgi:hypothetical protein
MTVTDRGRWSGQTRAERVRSRRVRVERVIEPAPRERKVRPKKGPRPRRRYDLALPVERGAEVRLPGLPIVRPGIRLLTAALLAVTAWLLQSVLTAGSFRVGEASVHGAELLTSGQVRSIAGVDGTLVFLVDPQAVEAVLLQQPEVERADVRVRWPNRVEISVQERRPVAEWNEASLTWWLSSDGIAFLQRGEREGLVRLTSDEPLLSISDDDPLAPAVEPEVLEAAVVLSTQLPEAQVLHIDRQHGFWMEDGTGCSAYFGFGGDMVKKVRLYHFIRLYLEQQRIEPAIVSVEDVLAPYYTVQR